MSPEEHSNPIELTAHTQVPEAAHADPGVISPDAAMAVLTWVTFFSLLAVLYKFAWKPILAALDERESKIQRALNDAQKAKEELEKIEQARAQRISEADQQAREIVDGARKAAIEATQVIERKAKEETQIMLGNATQEINALAEKAKVTLRQESADLAVALAGKIIDEKLHREEHQKLIDKFIEEFHPENYEKS